MARDNAWLVTPRPRPQARSRLYCLPYAGSSASAYRRWADLTPPDVECCAVQLPGRPGRFDRSPATRFDELVRELADEIGGHADRPYALFGHSMGALLAFETARLLAGTRRPPVLVVVSGQPEPQARPPAPAYHLMTDEGLIEVVSELGGLPPGIEAYPSLLPFMLEPLRADFRLLETYEYRPGPALPCPLLIFGGDADALAPVDRLETWTEAAGVTADVHVLPGGHFFLQDHEERMIATIIRAMSGPAVLYTTTWPATGRRRNDDRQE